MGRVDGVRLLSRCACAIGVTGTSAMLAAGSAATMTGPAPTTAAASAVASTAATANGVIPPSGTQVAYEFQYGTTTSYGQSTVPLVLPANPASENVSARIGGLKPRTTYHYRLVISISASQATASGTLLYPVAYSGSDATFKTLAPGRLSLTSTRLAVRKTSATVRLRCASSAGCNGTLTLSRTIVISGKSSPVNLGTASFSLPAQAGRTVTVPLNNLATTALSTATAHQLPATLTAKTTTLQRGFKRAVTLGA
jgi:hypothetical protein